MLKTSWSSEKARALLCTDVARLGPEAERIDLMQGRALAELNGWSVTT